MDLFGIKRRDELLEQAQEAINIAQSNNHKLTDILAAAQNHNETLVTSLATVISPIRVEGVPVTEEPTEERISPKLAAYALNLCMVSVSQIIQYRDVRIMEQEYDAILNNLNLQNFPKDEPLLNAIKQILDSITFFQVQDGERKMLEHEYQHKVKNAIWKAIPGLGIISGGSIFSAVASVAVQVGISYMNYRNAREEADLENDRKLWELERAAIEQFNGLRRELFETAWRLSKKYNYDENYRLTERIISQYNDILLDTDPLRRYERLLYLVEQKKFDAYPPIHYYLGHAAHQVYMGNPDQLPEYKKAAEQHLLNYINFFGDENELLREDLLHAQACLEYYGLLPKEERAQSVWLLEKAQEKSGNSMDVLQLCMIAYFEAGNFEKASGLLKMLINERYNVEVNAQLLSVLYSIQQRSGNDCRSQMTRLRESNPGVLLMNLPSNEIQFQERFDEFINLKRCKIAREYCEELGSIVDTYDTRFSGLWIDKKIEHREYIEFFMEMGDDIQQLCNYPRVEFIIQIESKLNTVRAHINDGAEPTAQKALMVFAEIVMNAVVSAAERVTSRLTQPTISDLLQLEDELLNYRKNHGQVSKNRCTEPQNQEWLKLSNALLGVDATRVKLRDEKTNACMEVLNRPKFAEKNLYSPNGEKWLIISKRGSGDFNSYVSKHNTRLKECECGENMAAKSTVLAIFNSRRFSDLDILITTDGLVYWARHKLVGKVQFSDVKLGLNEGKKVLLLGDSIVHDATDINADLFVNLCLELNTKISGAHDRLLLDKIEDVFKSVIALKPHKPILMLEAGCAPVII